MKSIKQTLLTLTFLAFTASLHAQTTLEQFQTAVVDYQQALKQKSFTPSSISSNVLKVIELYKQLDPPPAVPEEAREPFVMGVTVFKEANDASGAAKAVEFFTKAIKLAPWWAEARYNHALACEMSGQFDLAIYDLNIYLAFKLTEAERRQAQDKIYALKAKAELATAKKTEEDKVAAAKKTEEEKIAAAAKQEKADREKAEAAVKKSQSVAGNWKVYVGGRPQRAGGNSGSGTWTVDFHYRFEMQGEEITVYLVTDSDDVNIAKNHPTWLRRNGGGWPGKGDEDLFGRFTVNRNVIRGICLWNKYNTDLTGNINESEISWDWEIKDSSGNTSTHETLRKQD